MRFTCIQMLAKRIHLPSKYTPIYEQLLYGLHGNVGFFQAVKAKVLLCGHIGEKITF